MPLVAAPGANLSNHIGLGNFRETGEDKNSIQRKRHKVQSPTIDVGSRLLNPSGDDQIPITLRVAFIP